ncbi:acyl carrier protein [Reyranella sp. CPCC 100927]|uniref:acyl carrier protein n=1 Tax=Reyranella sp. CPCC 100927 TaxID=2599616 RepID=UPI0011B4D00B|nr:acyl carrier protein [Reyranella sp. CPCC 100927]TWT13698.1 acyl carrier protein [Reyranella sp. CPCC 100927]
MLSRSDILDMLRAYLDEMFEVAPARVSLDAKLYEDLDLDSIDAVDLVVRLQEVTGQKIKPDMFKNVRTVGDVVNCVEALLSPEGSDARVRQVV